MKHQERFWMFAVMLALALLETTAVCSQKKAQNPVVIAKPNRTFVSTKPDISFKPIVYLTKKEGNEIDPAKDRSVLAGKTISISVADASGFHPGQGYMEAYFAVVFLRNGGQIDKPLKVRFEFKAPLESAQSEITFEPKKTSAEYYFRLSLKPGIGKLKFDIDPEVKLQESNKKNNSLEVTLNVAALNVVQ